ncbi:MAG: diaminopimelate epimerase [Pseudohongiellaceae bacterium]
MRFTKVEGAGNDYVLVDETKCVVENPSQLARRVSDRHRGVGSDGLLLVSPASSEAVTLAGAPIDASMRIFNADGSEGRMCGNGLRCVVRFLNERWGLPADQLSIQTAAGLRVGRREADGAVWVGMGEPDFSPSSLPIDLPDRGELPAALALPRQLLALLANDVGAEPAVALAVSIGNPHLVICLTDPERADLELWGKVLQASPELAEGANVHLVGRPSGGVMMARPYERGSGATKACGTGAVAIAAVARRMGWMDPANGDELTISMPGGDLSVRWSGVGEAWLGGSASLVFDGELHTL